tara:strand:- start:712 stop:960 length:249 start_codon:yes stop_codon:yes gene_type:complete
MKKRRKGGLIQKIESPETPKFNFRIIAIKKPSEVWLIGRYNSFNKAKQIIDVLEGDDIHYYLEDMNSSRVLYSKVGKSSNGK